MRTKTSLAAKKKKPKLPHHMNDKIILAQNIKGTGKATFEGLYDIDDDPVTVVVDKNDDGVYIVIYKDIGESFYSPEQLSAAMTRVQQNIVAIESQIERINIELDNKKQAVRKLKPMYEQFKGWAEEFDLVPTEQKKMIISQLISRIEIGKGYKISIQLNMDYEQFCDGWMNKEKEASAICPIHNTKQKSP